MQERKNKLRLLVLVILIIATTALVWFNKRERSTGVDKQHFKTDLQGVDRIVLQGPADTITLTFNGTRWKVADEWYADRDMIEVLFATLQQASPVRPVPSAHQDSIQQALVHGGVLVELYAKGVRTAQFLAGGNPAKTQSYFSKPEEGKPFIVNIPGYRVYVSGIFELNESGWREKRVFAFNWQNFKKLTAHFPKNPKQDFEMVMDNYQIQVSGLAVTDTMRVNGYLDAVSLLTVDNYRDHTPSLDSLLSMEPIHVLTVSDIGERNFSLKLYLAPSQEIKGLINDSQWVEFDSQKIRSILLPKDFFAGH